MNMYDLGRSIGFEMRKNYFTNVIRVITFYKFVYEYEV